MRERGTVIRVENGVARVRIHIASAEACHTCNVCGEDAEGRYVDVEAPAGLEPGANVEVEVKDEAALGPAVMVFLLPVIAIIIGAALGWQLPAWLGRPAYSRTLFAILGAVLLLGLSAVAIRKYDRAYRSRGASARIIRTMDPE